MPVNTVVPRLQTILAAISGVTRAYDQLPGSLNKADLPVFLIVPGEATQKQLTGQGVQEERQYNLILYVQALSIDSFNSAYNACRPFFRLVQAAFQEAFLLNELTGVHWAHIEADSGVVPLIYGQSQYAGIEFRLRVIETYAATVDE